MSYPLPGPQSPSLGNASAGSRRVRQPQAECIAQAESLGSKAAACCADLQRPGLALAQEAFVWGSDQMLPSTAGAVWEMTVGMGTEGWRENVSIHPGHLGDPGTSSPCALVGGGAWLSFTLD